MTVHGYREIVGDRRFFEFTRDLLEEFAYDNVSTKAFIAFAKQQSGVTGADRQLLDVYFEQWLYGETQPTVVSEDFG